MNFVKDSVKISLATTIFLPAFLALLPAIAQNPPQPEAQPVDNSVAQTALPSDVSPNSPLGQIIQMLQSGTPENSILTNITNAEVPFNVNAIDLIYLNDIGAPSNLETALIHRDQQLGVRAGAQSPQLAPAGQVQEPQDITVDYFFGALAPYGAWTNLPGYGFCWQPFAANYNSDWTPYCTLGQWFYTDCGWYWLSGYSWGWSVFHYGRWFHDATHGWCWWPATTWAPSWVFWRYSGNFCGWAPLPPHCYYSEETGLMYNGASIASSYDFGIDANLFNFVPMATFFDGNIERFRLSASQSSQLFSRTEVRTGINSNDRIIVNDGIPLNKVAASTGGAMRSLTLQPVESVALPGARGERILPDGETLAINRPYVDAGVPSSLRQGIKPAPDQEQPVAHRNPTIIVNQISYSYPPPDNQNYNSVTYVDSAAQYGPPVPTVTTAGPQDYAGPQYYSAPAPCPVGYDGSYWSVSAEAPVTVDASSAYMSPQLQSREHWRHKVREPENHREFYPPAEGTRPEEHREDDEEHQESHPAATDLKNVDAQFFSQGPRGTPSHTHPSTPAPTAGEPARAASGSPGHEQSHGH
ncbi:MAG TPA: DUF6600 domain-containing protein [Verrucomicrobiae bacterium]|nr:DUF6600 domain-containing protein [Verrucomicrobiae bacterium]